MDSAHNDQNARDESRQIKDLIDTYSSSMIKLRNNEDMEFHQKIAICRMIRKDFDAAFLALLRTISEKNFAKLFKRINGAS